MSERANETEEQEGPETSSFIQALEREIADFDRQATEILEENIQEIYERHSARVIQHFWRLRKVTTTMTTKTVTINGVKFDVMETARELTDESQALYPKAERAKLEPAELNKLFEKAWATSQTKYHLLDMKIEDPDKLKETYDLEMAIDKTRNNHAKFDMTDVFTVVVLDKTDPMKVLRTVDLYKDYGNVTEKEVAQSNRFYATRIHGDSAKFLAQNLQLTHSYMVNNTEDSLLTKVNETYNAYPIEEKGGPLFFKIMIDILQNNSDEAAKYLISVVKNLKITNYDGENVDKVVSLIRGAYNRLTNLRSNTKQSLLPDDFPEMILKVFQTSSVMEFNTLFAHEKRELDLQELRTGEKKYPKVSDILSFATTRYRALYATGEWNGVKTKANETSFTAGLTAATTTKGCFNCGGNHALQNCPQPKDESRISANKKQFWDAKRNRQNNSGNQTPNGNNKSPRNKKWAPPTDAERKNKNIRVIDGKDYYYHYKTKKWIISTRPRVPAQATPGANVATTTTIAPVTQEGTTAATATEPQANSAQARDLAVANLSRQYEVSLRGLMEQFHT